MLVIHFFTSEFSLCCSVWVISISQFTDCFIWALHSAVEPFYWDFNLVIIISIWLLLTPSISLLSCSILFTIRVLIINEAFLWCSLHVCENSITDGILILSSIDCFIQFETYLVLDIMSNLLLQPGTLWYYIMRFWYLFKFSVLGGFISHYPRSGREGASSLLPGGKSRHVSLNLPSWPQGGPPAWCCLSQQNETESDSEAKASFIPWSENREVWGPGPEHRLSCRLWAGLLYRVPVSNEWAGLFAHSSEPRCKCSHYPSGTLVWSARFEVSARGCLWASDTRLSTEEKKKRSDLILLPRFCFYSPGIVHGLCWWWIPPLPFV